MAVVSIIAVAIPVIAITPVAGVAVLASRIAALALRSVAIVAVAGHDHRIDADHARLVVLNTASASVGRSVIRHITIRRNIAELRGCGTARHAGKDKGADQQRIDGPGHGGLLRPGQRADAYAKAGPGTGGSIRHTSQPG